MRIYHYDQQAKPRPACVQDGGYLYDPDTETVVGFGTAESDLEITVSEARTIYDAIMENAAEPSEQTADEFLADHGVDV